MCPGNQKIMTNDVGSLATANHNARAKAGNKLTKNGKQLARAGESSSKKDRGEMTRQTKINTPNEPGDKLTTIMDIDQLISVEHNKLGKPRKEKPTTKSSGLSTFYNQTQADLPVNSMHAVTKESQRNASQKICKVRKNSQVGGPSYFLLF